MRRQARIARQEARIAALRRAVPLVRLEHLMPSLRDRKQTVLVRSMLAAGQRVHLGLMQFWCPLTDEEVRAFFGNVPMPAAYQLGRDLWAQEWLPGRDSDEILVGATT